MSRIKSKKYDGVYLNKLTNGDISYSITYKNEYNLSQRFTIGRKSAGITEIYCKNKRDEIINKIRLGEDPISHKKTKKITTIDDLAKLYFEQTVQNKDSKKTHNKYSSRLEKKFGKSNITLLTSDDILAYQTELVNEGLSASTINFYIIFIGTLYNIAIEEKLFDGINPIKNKKIKLLKLDNQRERFLSTNDIGKLYANITDEDIKLFINLSLSTGGRLETILHIQKKDIDLKNKIVTLKDLKNGTTYNGFMNNELVIFLENYTQNLKLNTFIIGGKDTKYATRTLQRKLQSTMNKLFNEGLDSKDTKNRVVIHSLRHTFASHLAINGTPIFTIQKLMNHTDIKMTLRYAKLAPDSGKEFVNKLYK